MDSPKKDIKKCNYATNRRNNLINEIIKPDIKSIRLRYTILQPFYTKKKVELPLLIDDKNQIYLETLHNGSVIKVICCKENNLDRDIDYSLSYLHSLKSVKKTDTIDTNADVMINVIQYLNFIKTIDKLSHFKMNIIICLVNADIENAYWNGQYFVFGSPDNVLSPRGICKPLTSSAIIGHELTHALIDHIHPLEYHSHSGSINESICDCMAVVFEEYVFERINSISYELGSELYESSCLRDMRKPRYMYDQYYVENSLEDGNGVHSNSAILNYQYYLLAEQISKRNALLRFINVWLQLPNTNATIQEFLNLLNQVPHQ